MGSPTSVDCPIRYVLSFDTGEKCRQALDFSAVAFLKPKLSGYARQSRLPLCPAAPERLSPEALFRTMPTILPSVLYSA